MPSRGLPKNSRYTSPDRLVGATNFSKDREVVGPIALVELIKSQQWFWDQLSRATDLDAVGARERDQGHWILAYVAFTVSRIPNIEPWLEGTTPDLWRACGFEGPRRYSNVYKRFRELEADPVLDAILAAAGLVVQQARRHDSRVGAHVHVDGTEAETHAMLRHVCEPDKCPNGRRPTRRRGYGRRVSVSEAQDSRHAEADAVAPERPTEQDPRLDLPGAPKVFKPEQLRRDHKGRLIRRIELSDGCVYETLDPDAGVRAYSNRRFWHGYYHQKVIDHFTGGVLFAGVYTASLNEEKTFPHLYNQVERALNNRPETVTADRGFSFEQVFEFCTTRGTAAIIPWRAHGATTEPKDYDTHDRHGVWRCKHCGSPTDFVRFSTDGGKPRTWARCLYPVTDSCGRDQTFNNSRDYRLLTPLWQTDPLYHLLQDSHQSYEAVHNWWRTRYSVAGKDASSRPKMRRIGAHRLRSAVATLIEWVRICSTQGWLASARRRPRTNDELTQATRVAFGVARSKRDQAVRRRMNDGLEDPYGDAAHRVGATLGLLLPPSERPKAPEKGDDASDADVNRGDSTQEAAGVSASPEPQSVTGA